MAVCLLRPARVQVPDPPIRVLELRSVRGTGGGPEKTILQGAATADPTRFAVTVCYVRDLRDAIFRLDQRAGDLNIDYVEVHERNSFDPSIFGRLRRLVRDRQINIVHAHDYKTNALALLLSRFEAVTPLSTAHGWTGHTLRERLVYYPADKRLLARFPRVIAVSSGIRLELLKRGASADKVTVVLNGIDHRVFRRRPELEARNRRALGFDDGDVVIGAVGRLAPQKRFDLLIDAFDRLRQARPHLRLVIAGEGGSRPQLEEQIRSRRLGRVCRLAGQCDDVAGLHHALDLFVQSSDYEGTPNAVLEAMALGTPVVATDVGGTSELVRNGTDGLLVAPGNLGQLTNAISQVVDSFATAAGRTAAARRRVETELSFDSRMRKVEAIYQDLVSQGAQGTIAAAGCTS